MEEGLRDLENLENLENLVTDFQGKAATTGHWADYLRAHGVANYLLHINYTKERSRLVYDIEKKWYEGKHPLSYKEHQILTNKHKQQLVDYRDEMKHSFNSIRSGDEVLDIDDMFSETNLNNAHILAHLIFSVSKMCSEGFIRYSHSIMSSCVQLLTDDGIVSPCSFAVIGLGSVAQGEATPYSDLAYAFIVEDDTDVDYFMKLAVDSYFRIGNLGESPLKIFGIKYTSKGSAVPPPMGYRIDGISTNAGYIPTGHPDCDQRLILTVDKLMELYRKEVMSPHSELADLSYLLTSSVMIYSHVNGEKLYQQFLEARLTFEREVATKDMDVRKRYLGMMSHDMRMNNFLPEDMAGVPQNKHMQLQVDTLRHPSLLAANLNILMTLNSRYYWNTYAKLHQLGMLTTEDHIYMNIVLALSIYIPTSAYLAMGRQSVLLPLYTSSRNTVTNGYSVPIDLLVTLGCLLVPIMESISSALQRGNRLHANFQTTDITSGIRSVNMNFQMSKTDFMLKTKVLCFAGEFERAVSYLYSIVGENIVNKCEQLIGVIRAKYNTTKSDPSERKYLAVCDFVLYSAKKYDIAIDYLSWLITYHVNTLTKVELKLNIGVCMQKLGKFKHAKRILNQVVVMLEEWLSPDRSQGLVEYILQRFQKRRYFSDTLIFCTQLTLRALQSYGDTFHNLKNFELAIDCYQMSVEIYRLMRDDHHFTQKADYSYHIALLLSFIAGVHFDMANYPLSLLYYKESLGAFKQMYGERCNHPSIANCYHNIGVVYSELDDNTESLASHCNALETRRAIYDGCSNQAEVFNSLMYIGDLYGTRHRYSLAFRFYNEALQIESKGEGIIASLLSRIAYVWFGLADYRRAKQFLEVAIMKTPASNSNYHKELAQNCFGLGNLHLYTNSWSKSWNCFSSALSLCQCLPRSCERERLLADIHFAVGDLLLRLGHVTHSLEHAQRALELSNELLVKSSSQHRLTRLKKMAKSLTDSLHLVKIAQHQFPSEK